ncbi:thioesterase family protein [Nocardioides sp. zg-ZUI104]|uniref:thioesterase family protein n=1 Tax=Nocardioides faecalis TaxID=2803858 RepID=UPI001BCB8229|nr:thioesterase family protein [Nocardioides faecalis]MBS4754592.1 thioesterase family protein [Nocardioides faecalis]
MTSTTADHPDQRDANVSSPVASSPVASAQVSAPAGRGTGSCYALLESRTDADGTVVETFASHQHTGSAWGPMQHGGPVAGLLTRAMERLGARPGARISKVSVDILGAVPIDEVRVSARVERPGRRIELLSAVMEAADGAGGHRPVARASAWRLASSPTDDVVWQADGPLPFPGPGGVPGLAWLGLPDGWALDGFVDAVTWNMVDRGGEPGHPTTAWLRLDCPLVAGEETTALQRTLTLADTVNGVGARLDPATFTFLNTDMTVHLHTVPRGEWLGIRAENTTGPDGVGMSVGVLYDVHGPVARVTQNVLVERRPGA